MISADLSQGAKILIGILSIMAAIVFSIWPHSLLHQKKVLGINSNFISFFHPKCDGNGGGERVLWTAISAIQKKYPGFLCVVYCWDGLGDNVIEQVEQHFGISIDPQKVLFLKLSRWEWLEANRYTRFTLIGQSLGSLIVAWEAISLLRPTIYVETVGFAFTYPLVKLFGSKVVCYVHYPTISSDMLAVVKDRKAQFNNSQLVAKSAILSTAKLAYYKSFAWLYGFVGSFADVVMVNSSWTRGHIKDIWKVNCSIVYPPCDTLVLSAFPLEKRKKDILSIAQFRPEKNHFLQLDAISTLLKKYPTYKNQVKLVMVGSVRNPDDQKLVDKVRSRILELNIESNVEIVTNASFDVLLYYLKNCSIGLHCMNNEHFGISVVEYMAAGLIPIAHNSGGPKFDIVINDDKKIHGFLATTDIEYADYIHKVLTMPAKDLRQIRQHSRKFVQEKFSGDTFATNFLQQLINVIENEL